MKVTSVMTVLLLAGSSTGLSPTGSIQITNPQRLSVSLGVCGTDFFGVFGSESGPVLRVEPGFSGGKIHVGMRSMFNLMFLPIASAEVTGAVLRTWNDPWGVAEDQTFAGGEFRLGLQYFVFTAGAYKHIAGESEDEWLYSLGAGLGL